MTMYIKRKKSWSHDWLFLFSISINFFKVKRLFLGCRKGMEFCAKRHE